MNPHLVFSSLCKMWKKKCRPWLNISSWSLWNIMAMVGNEQDLKTVLAKEGMGSSCSTRGCAVAAEPEVSENSELPVLMLVVGNGRI
jgi:hypothetical protein